MNKMYRSRNSPGLIVEVVFHNDHVIVYRDVRTLNKYHKWDEADGVKWSRDYYSAYRMVAPHTFNRRFIPVE